jgi:hypothetical protein
MDPEGVASGGQEPAGIKGARSRRHEQAAQRAELGLGEPESGVYALLGWCNLLGRVPRLRTAE